MRVGNAVIWRRLAAALAIVAASALSGCGGAGARPHDMSASPVPTTTASHTGPSATPSPVRTGPLTTGPGVLPGEKPPVEHELATVHSQAGGYAFATYFMEALSWSIATNDGWLVDELSSPQCATCKRYLQTIDTLHAKHESQRGGRPIVKSSHRLLGPLPYGAEVAIEYVIDDTAAILLPGNTTSHAHPNLHTVIYLVWSGRGWTVREQAE